MAGPGGGEGGTGREVEKERPVDEHGRGRPRILTERDRAGSTGTVGAGESRGSTGTEQSHFHGCDFRLSAQVLPLRLGFWQEPDQDPASALQVC